MTSVVYLFDTNVLSEFTNRRPNGQVLRKLMACAPTSRFASDMTRFELRHGAALLPPGNTMWQRIESDVLPRCTWLPISADICLQTADLAAKLRLAGKTIDLADLFIAATGLVHDLIVVTRNVRHFDRIDGLQIENWFPQHTPL